MEAGADLRIKYVAQKNRIVDQYLFGFLLQKGKEEKRERGGGQVWI